MNDANSQNIHMNAATQTIYIPRGVALVKLSAIRYGDDALELGRFISQPTLWRWCDRLGIPSDLDCFSGVQFDQLAAIAKGLRLGKSLNRLLKELNIQ